MSSPIIEKTTFGLTIASDFIPTAETVAMCIYVKTGSRHERSDQNGISHFLEHMAFKGTKSRTATQIAQQFDAIGGQFNAYTSHEETVYYAKVLKDDWATGLDILADIIQNSVYDPIEMDKERGVIIQEIAQYQDLPDAVVADNFQTIAYPDQPLGRNILGSVDFIRNLSRDQLMEYVSSRYHSKNIIVSAAGNIDHKPFADRVKKTLSDIPVDGEISTESGIYKGGESRQFKELEQLNIYIGFKGLSYNSKDVYKYRLSSLILGGGMSSRLFQEVREKRGLAYHISSYHQSYVDSGLFVICAGTNPEDTNELIDVSIGEIKALCNEGVHKDELLRAKNQLKSAILMSRENVSNRAEKLASNLAYYERYITPQEVLEKIEKVSDDDITSVFNNLLSHQNGNISIASLGRINNIYSYDEINNKLRSAS
jgi:predicted Zn-dependent peptidase